LWRNAIQIFQQQTVPKPITALDGRLGGHHLMLRREPFGRSHLQVAEQFVL
jgi:hypothetical protein